MTVPSGMDALLAVVAAGTLAVVLATVVEFARGYRTLRRLRDVPPPDGEAAPPRVSVIVAARNEARHVESAVRSLLAQDYPDLELIIVDDRSTDGTGGIVDRLAGEDLRLEVLHVTELPAGWLGKNHALHIGAARARGELLLFTDADVVMEPTAISRAVTLLRTDQLDHLAVTPSLAMPGVLLEMLGGTFAMFFGVYAKPWKASDPRSRCHIGIGAFNLVRAEAYRAAGGHRAIALRPDDDMKLGKLLKRAGYRQALALGQGLLRVEWYTSVGELVRGLEKNSFAGLEYRLGRVVAASLVQFIFLQWPFVALAVTGGATRLLNLAVVLALGLGYVVTASAHGMKRWHVIGLPLTALLFQYIVWRAVLLTLLRGGIRWRETRYALAELKANKV